MATLAKAKVRTSDAAMAQCLRSARGVAEALASGGWSVVDTTDKLGEPYRERAQAIAVKLNDALGHDEHVTQLAGVLESCRTAALELLTEAATRPPPEPPPKPPAPEPPEKTDKRESEVAIGRRSVAAAEIDTVFTEIRNAVRKADAARVDIEWRVYSGNEDEKRSP